MKKHILLFTVIIGLLSCNQEKPNLTNERINYLIEVKNKTAENYWSNFNHKNLFGSMLYYTKSGLYVINANEQLKGKINTKPFEHKNSNVNILFSKTIDTTNFYMNVSYDGTNTSALEYKNTLGMFSDINLTEKFIPEVKGIQQWSSMVIHEMFHQYQRQFEKFKTAQESSQRNFNRDTLNHFSKTRFGLKKVSRKKTKPYLRLLQKARVTVLTRISLNI